MAAHGKTGAQPDAAWLVLSHGDRVTVLNPRDPHAGQTGTVRRVWLDAGDLVVRVAFADGMICEYFEDELQCVVPDPM
jgi:hypothetical protein